MKNLSSIFRNKKVTILGLGINDGALKDALFFIKKDAQLTITDLKTRKELKKSLDKLIRYKGIKYTLGYHKKEDFINADLIIKNPAVSDSSPYLEIAKKHSVEIDTSIGIFSKYTDMKNLIGVTGTKGKSTTTDIIYKFIKTKYKNAYLAGNIGLSPIKYTGKNTLGVLELSSFNLEGMAKYKKSPHIACITNRSQDHLNRYKNFAEYKKAKELIFKFQRAGDWLILNYDDPVLINQVKKGKSRILFFSVLGKPRNNAGAFLKNGNIYIKNKKLCSVSDLPQNVVLENILCALACAILFKIPQKNLLRVLKNYKGLSGRVEKIKVINGIEIYNDTTATNPTATLKSLELFKDKKVGLILGGEDKKLDYKPLLKELKSVAYIALLPGTASDKIEVEAKKLKIASKLKKVKTLRQALVYVYKQKPKIILFSPAAASFNQFQNEFDRGEKFNDVVSNMYYGNKKHYSL